MRWIAKAAFAMEGIVARELRDLGLADVRADNGQVVFEGSARDGFLANMWLRTSDRVLLEMGRFEARSFDELFESVKAIAWEDILPADAAFPVRCNCVRSVLMSPSDCQKIIKKSVAERLKSAYGGDWLSESGAEYAIDCSVHEDIVTLSLDASGTALNKRGYRTWNGEAPLRETLAAALVLLMPWRPGQPLIDPCCGSGTILCEAAMIASDRAPGLKREFAMEKWQILSKEDIASVRGEAEARFHAHDDDDLMIEGTDIDPEAVELARRHIKACGFEGRIRVFNRDLRDFRSPYPSGAIIANPPYGERLGDRRVADAVARALRLLSDTHPEFALGVITSNPNFEKVFSRRADKRRRLYNGRLECEFMIFDRESFRQKARLQKRR